MICSPLNWVLQALFSVIFVAFLLPSFSCQQNTEKESNLLFLNTHKQIVNKPWKLTKPLPPAVVTQAQLSHHTPKRQLCHPPVSYASIQLLFSPPKIYCGKISWV